MLSGASKRQGHVVAMRLRHEKIQENKNAGRGSAKKNGGEREAGLQTGSNSYFIR